MLCSTELDAQIRKTDPAKLRTLVRSHMPIDWLVQEEFSYIPRLLPVVGIPDSILALVRTVFELVVEIYTSSTNRYQYQYNENS